MAVAVHVSRHPLLLHRLTQLRDKTTGTRVFRQLVHEMAQMLFFEASQDLRLTSRTVQTPLTECAGQQIAESVGLVPILRAGLGMEEAILDMIPSAQVWHLGLYRDHKTLKPITYYNKLTEHAQLDHCFIVDPMLATGGSALAALDILKKWPIRNFRFLAIIAAPEGVRVLQESHPDVPIYLAALDTHLNEHSYIVPGLGDAGDRAYGTK